MAVIGIRAVEVILDAVGSWQWQSIKKLKTERA
jgi:hypothetical protein